MNQSVIVITEILQGIGLSHEEGTLFMKASLFPGLTPRQLEFQCEFSRMSTYRILERLEDRGYLSIRKTDTKRRVFAIPFDELSRRLTSFSEKLLRRASEMDLLHKLAKQHRREDDFSLETFTGDEALNSYFSVHALPWSNVLAAGDLEPFFSKIGDPLFKQWPQQRAKKGRKGKGLLTTNGPHIGELISHNKRLLRTTRHTNNLQLSNQWIETIPDQNLTMIFTAQDVDNSWTFTKINSEAVSRSYANIVESYFR